MSSDTSKSGTRVLLVEDYEDTRAMYAAYLRHQGYEIVEAGDGTQAQEAAVTTRPDIVVMDMALPDVDGWEVTARLKDDERTRDIPVVALTGHGLAEHKRRAREVGCDGFLLKPCLPDALDAEIRRILADDGASPA